MWSCFGCVPHTHVQGSVFVVGLSGCVSHTRVHKAQGLVLSSALSVASEWMDRHRDLSLLAAVVCLAFCCSG
jgi:hypothetical protein